MTVPSLRDVIDLGSGFINSIGLSGSSNSGAFSISELWSSCLSVPPAGHEVVRA